MAKRYKPDGHLLDAKWDSNQQRKKPVVAFSASHVNRLADECRNYSDRYRSGQPNKRCSDGALIDTEHLAPPFCFPAVTSRLWCTSRLLVGLNS
jgi:hypothetical protein